MNKLGGIRYAGLVLGIMAAQSLPLHAQTNVTCGFLKEVWPAASRNFDGLKGPVNNDNSHMPFEGRQYRGRKIAPGALYCDVVESKTPWYACVYVDYRARQRADNRAGPRAITNSERQAVLGRYDAFVSEIKGCVPKYSFKEAIVRKPPNLAHAENEFEGGLVGKIFSASADGEHKQGSERVSVQLSSFRKGDLSLYIAIGTY